MSARPTPSLAVFAAAALPALAAYLVTLNPTVPAGDSGELIAAAATFGVAHPPGYPLYVALGWLWIHLLPIGEPALRLNLLSAVCAASAAGVLALAAFRLTRSWAAALVAAWTLAFSAPLWKYAVVAEVFAPNALLAACALLAFVAAGASAAARAAIAAIATALLSLHHTLVLLVAPIVAVLVLQRVGPFATRTPTSTARGGARGAPSPAARAATSPPTSARGEPLRVAIAAVAGLAFLVIPPLAARSVRAQVWGDPTSARGFLRLLARADYGSFRLDPASAGMTADRPHGLLFLESLPHGLGVVALVLAAIGVVVAARRHRPLAIVLAGFAVLQAAFFSRIGFPSTVPVLRGAVERFYILPELVLALLAGIGAAWVVGATRRAWSALLVVALAVASPVATHARLANQAGNRFTEHLGEAMLASLPDSTVLFVQGDLQHNALVYLTRVRGRRPDVAVIDQELLTYDWYARRVRRRWPGLLPPLDVAQRIRLRDGSTIDGVALPRGDGAVDLLLEQGSATVDTSAIRAVEPADGAAMFARTRAGFRNDWLVPPGDDRYSGLPGSRNLLWLEHLRGRRPVAFVGFKDDSWALRWELMPAGLVALAYPRGATPAIAAQAETSLRLLARTALRDYFRDYDPTSFEAAERGRLPEAATRAALLVCQPATAGLGVAPDTTDVGRGRAALLAFAARFEPIEPTPDPACLRALGFLRVFAPDFRDPARGRGDLERYLATGAAGAEADEARRLLASLPAHP